MAYFLGITGTHSTGKSTFIQELKDRAVGQGISVATIGDTATRCQDKGFKVLLGHTFESTLWIITSVIKSELEAEMSAELVLVDRPVSDALGYLEAALEMTDRRITEYQREYLYSLVKMHVPRYEILLKTELDESIPLGDGRDQNLKYRANVDHWISQTLAKLNISTLNPDTMNKDQVIETIFSDIIKARN